MSGILRKFRSITLLLAAAAFFFFFKPKHCMTTLGKISKINKRIKSVSFTYLIRA